GIRQIKSVPRTRTPPKTRNPDVGSGCCSIILMLSTSELPAHRRFNNMPCGANASSPKKTASSTLPNTKKTIVNCDCPAINSSEITQVSGRNAPIKSKCQATSSSMYWPVVQSQPV